MEPSRNIRRQPAWHVFASEFGEATLNEKGSGEYDPFLCHHAPWREDQPLFGGWTLGAR